MEFYQFRSRLMFLLGRIKENSRLRLSVINQFCHGCYGRIPEVLTVENVDGGKIRRGDRDTSSLLAAMAGFTVRQFHVCKYY